MISACIMDYGDPAEVTRVRPAHQAYQFKLIKLIDEGKVIAAGSLLHPDDGGLFLYEAPSLEAAQQVVDADPYVLEGCTTRARLREYQIHGANAALLHVSKK